MQDMTCLYDLPRGSTSSDFVRVAMGQLPENPSRSDIEHAMHHAVMAWGSRVREVIEESRHG